MAEERILQVRLTLKSLKSIRNLQIDNECMPIRRRDDGMIEMQALAREETVAKLRRRKKSEVMVEVLADQTDEAASAKRLVSPVNRYADGSLPRGPGTTRN
jgi:hypothetical protein